MQILCLSTGCTSLQSYQFTRVLYHFFNFYVNEKYIIVKSKELCLQLEIFRQDQRKRRPVNFNSGHRKDSCCFALGAPSLLSYLSPKRFMIMQFRTSTTFLSFLSFLLLPISMRKLKPMKRTYTPHHITYQLPHLCWQMSCWVTYQVTPPGTLKPAFSLLQHITNNSHLSLATSIPPSLLGGYHQYQSLPLFLLS